MWPSVKFATRHFADALLQLLLFIVLIAIKLAGGGGEGFNVII